MPNIVKYNFSLGEIYIVDLLYCVIILFFNTQHFCVGFCKVSFSSFGLFG